MRVVVGVVVLGVLLVTGCGGGESGPPSGGESSVVSTPSCTPGTVTCSAEEAETQRLQAEFIDAYWAQLRETERLFANGGADQPSEELERTTAGPRLDDTAMNLRLWKDSGYRLSGSVDAWITLKPGSVHEGSDPRFSAEYCEDGRNTVATLPDGSTIQDGAQERGMVYGKVFDGSVKVIAIVGERVESCH